MVRGSIDTTSCTVLSAPHHSGLTLPWSIFDSLPGLHGFRPEIAAIGGFTAFEVVQLQDMLFLRPS